MVILGGMGNTVGVVLAAILLTVLPECSDPVRGYRMVIYSLLLIVLMLTCGRRVSSPAWAPDFDGCWVDAAKPRLPGHHA
jgi:branched-chain amino acid transport system permease protein